MKVQEFEERLIDLRSDLVNYTEKFILTGLKGYVFDEDNAIQLPFSNAVGDVVVIDMVRVDEDSNLIARFEYDDNTSGEEVLAINSLDTDSILYLINDLEEIASNKVVQ